MIFLTILEVILLIALMAIVINIGADLFKTSKKDKDFHFYYWLFISFMIYYNYQKKRGKKNEEYNK